jgi:tetratricopeptide (TPR) repeat protein
MIKLVLIFILFVLLGCQVNNRKSVCSRFQHEYSAAIKQMNNKIDTSKLIMLLNKLVTTDSLCKDIYLTRGDILIYSDESIDLAKQDYQKCLTLDSNNIYSLYRLGVLYQLVDKYDSSIHYFQRALSKKSYKNAVINYYQNSNLSDDISKYDIDYIRIVYGLGESYYYKGELRSALINFNTCIKDNFLLSKSYLFRGSIHLESNRKEKACEDFNLSLKYGNPEAEVYIKKYCSGK